MPTVERNPAASSSPIVETDEKECAWCLAEQGIKPQSGSHGICHMHAQQLVEQSRKRREERRRAGGAS